jgi:3-hydroxyacyl-[acyl-carrier-protein] dehydratase
MQLDVAAIKRLLPHRYPILLVDRVVEAEPGQSLVAIKAVTANEPCYAGVCDGPGDYAYPPSLLIESWCQAAGLLMCLETPNPDVLADRVTLFVGITGLRLSGRVRPGDVLTHHVRLVRAFRSEAMLEGESTVGDEVVLRVEHVVIALRPATATSPGPPTAALAAPDR